MPSNASTSSSALHSGYISQLPAERLAADFPRSIAVMGSTGSIGVNTLNVAAEHPDAFKIIALAGARNIELLAKQADKWRPKWLAVLDANGAKKLQELLPAGYSPEIVWGADGNETLATLPEVSMVVAAQVGAAGLRPALAAAKAGKTIALANKEALVLAGELFRQACSESGAVILPVDSEHNALFQGLSGHAPEDVRRIILTASGGPFRGRTKEELAVVTPEMALKHPNWSMGAKVTIDSSTLMNKGLEVIEAYHLYGQPLENIAVVVHPQSIIHSLVEYHDGSQLAHLGQPDMRIPIAYCMGWPKRLPLSLEPLDLAKVGSLTFQEPDLEAFPCLALAMQSLDPATGGPGQRIVLNAANEIAVAAFLEKKISYLDIPRLLRKALEEYARSSNGQPGSLEEILELDSSARKQAEAMVASPSF